VSIAAASSVWVAAPAGAADPTPVVVIVMENESYGSIVGNPQAPFINSMISGGDTKTNYVAVTPGSAHNYLAMTSGVTDKAAAKTAPNLFAALGNGTSWRSFEESMPSTCFPHASSSDRVAGSSKPLYARGHDPAMFYNSVVQTSLCNNVVPMDKAHFDPNNLPTFSYVVPNQCNDMHTMPSTNSCPMWDGTTNHGNSQIAIGDSWLSQVVPLVENSATVVLTWDEGPGGGEHIVTVIFGAGINSHTDNTAYTHYGLEAGLYAHFGLGNAPGQGKSATPVVIP
jgi:hypothetical protein